MSSTLVLVVNSGSSSLKYQLIDPDSGEVHAKGLVERIGEAGSEVPDHARALERALSGMGDRLDPAHLLAVGHRVVHGGAHFSGPTVIDGSVRSAIAELAPLAPLHNPANLQGIEATIELFPDTPQVAVFDTAFHQTIPPAAYTYAVPREWRDDLRVRRYGFHGTSHAYVSRRAAELLGLAVEDAAFVVLHLGNGCSATAVLAGESVETSMGLTPLEGLVMGTRSGDVDPSLGAYLARMTGMDAEAVDQALNKRSGLLGLTGDNDCRAVSERASAGDADARLALDVMVHRLVKYTGAYAAVLGRIDAVVLTGGIGEHAEDVRALLAGRLGLLGVELDAEANETGGGARRITTASSRTAMLVVPTNEELEIALQAAALVRERTAI
ncbi:acetate/propionate family kinase [Nostocoides sp. F2B08]|uniref:acetate/propionate family kinase n=1 Tax=Nostocoides sp. F2B08 TaxID=2653936 RepID=UPI001263144D|nr:acetate kinase [Tetrasphaera sp. F2B08]KAB7742984.1 acetate/propionate family kinase [Tetrasphaera sp. F2B08]